MGVAKINHADLAFMDELLEAGKVVPVIERCYPLGDVAKAIRYLVDEPARGKVVIAVDPAGAGIVPAFRSFE